MIQYIDVTKKYGALTAVSHFSLEIKRGEFFGLLGPNGAGKTTLVRMTTTLTPVSGGQIFIDGEPIDRNHTRIKRKFGVVPQYSNMEGELTAFENLEYHGRLYGMKRPQRHSRCAELLEFCDLTARKNDKAKTFSGGMQRKLMIAKALMHKPEILLLDEPTVGLDALWRRRIWDLLRNLNKLEITVFLTTHYLEEAQSLCHRVGLIDQGALQKIGEPAQIIAAAGNYVLEYFHNGTTMQEFFAAKEAAVAAAARQQGDFKVREANLEDAFILLTNKRLEI
ncbi:ABC transporter ATP-binding protein [Spirochaetia bacterium]|nr:ABC transporter ATP-binding protein [Spirochaetia bacterium]